MMREVLSAVLAMLLATNLNYAASQVDSKTAKTRVLAIPMGSLVDVHLNHSEKVRGRMGEVSDEGFVVQTAQGKVETRKIAFTDMNSIKLVGKSHTTRNILIVAGIGVGVVAIVLLVAIRSVHLFRGGVVASVTTGR